MSNKFFQSYDSVEIGDWCVKISVLDNTWMIFIWNPIICESQVEWFDSEYEAVLWLDYMTAKYV
jgi:hypothetical protein